jgi:hypothetical protein
MANQRNAQPGSAQLAPARPSPATRKEVQQLQEEHARELARVKERYGETIRKLRQENQFYKDLRPDLTATAELIQLNRTLSDRIAERETELRQLRAEYESHYANQLRSLEAKVFELAGGIEYASDGTLGAMHKRAFSLISNKVPTLFGIPGPEDSLQRKMIKEHSSSDFEVFEKHGLDIYYSLCESWTFRSIWTHIQHRFCVGLEDGLGSFHPAFRSRREDLGKAISALGGIIQEEGNKSPGKWTHSRACNV